MLMDWRKEWKNPVRTSKRDKILKRIRVEEYNS